MTITRSFFLFFVISFISITGTTQSVNENVSLKKLLFNNFLKGKVYNKSNNAIEAPLNYNTDNQNFVFIDNGMYKELTGIETIDSIVVDNVKFIPIKNKFFQCTSSKDVYILYYNMPVSNEVTTDKNGTHKKSTSEVSNTVSNVYSFRNFKNQTDITFVKQFWIKDVSTFVELKYPKQIAKAFNMDKAIVSDFIEINKIDLHFEPDVLKLIAYLNGFKKS